MKKTLLIAMITSTVMVAALGVGSFFLFKQSEKIKDAQNKTVEAELDIFLEDVDKEVFDSRELNEIHTDTSDKPLSSVYSENFTQEQDKQIKKNKKKNLYDFESPMWMWNLYGTNTLSMYTYFKTKQPSYVRYTIQVEDASIPNFTRTLYNGEAGNVTREHEYQLTGFVPGCLNYLVLELYDEKGDFLNRKVYTIEVPELKSGAKTKLELASGRSEEQITNGLYTVFGMKNIWLYDNSGVLRGEIPLKERSSQRILQEKGGLIYATSKNEIVKVGSLGQIQKIYDLGAYEQYEDFLYNGYGKLWIMVSKPGKKSKSIKDTVISLDLKTKEVKELFSMETLLPKMEEKAKRQKGKKTFDWVNINAITQVNSDEVLVSSKELSSIFKVVKINSREPRISFIIGEKEIWKNSGYEKKLLEKTGQKEADEEQKTQQEESVLDLGDAKEVFYATFGQTWLEKQRGDGLAEGQYYLYVWDSNYGNSPTRKDIRWSQYRGVGTDKREARYSYIQKYLVDENAALYNLEDTIKVEYTKEQGSAQFYGQDRIDNYGYVGAYAEYDKNGQLLRKFTHGLSGIYRVEKLDYKEFWYQ